ncbi:sorting nexin-7-like [Anthonomus grandis grandis]|uniref:sorting nexin-7-like n=1 Tax=Anthonomus grandis grandis TaxID=2921223 RepID=UPI00216578D7|nr:sorting nexin-7-like [Anthonomus grandis grandis]
MGTQNPSAVLDVISEHKEITALLSKDSTKDLDHSSICSGSTFDNDNSLVHSPSIESFSSIQDIENLAELNMDEDSDLTVKIDNPEKHLDTMETYITFRVTTRSARIEFSDHEYVVRRRYKDFLWLRHRLIECHPFCIVPPLPAKHSLIGQLDRYSKDFIITRMKSLNVFVSRICHHPILSCNENFKVFLTASPSNFATYRKKKASVTSSNGSITTLSSTHSTLKSRHIEFDKMKSYLSTLAEKLNSIEKISSRINKERSDLIAEISNFHPIFTKWASFEPQLCTTLENIAHALERSSNAQSALVLCYSNSMSIPIREFLQYIEVVQEALKKRELSQYNYEMCLDELNRRHTEKDRLLAISQDSNHHPPTGGFTLWRQPTCDDKLEKLGAHIPQLLKKVETAQDNLEMASESLRSDLEGWQLEKKQCIKKILLDFVNKQINYYQANVNAWEHVTNEMISSRKVNPSTK